MFLRVATWWFSTSASYTEPLFYALVLFLKKWAEIKKAVPIKSNGMGSN
jgi:hypothetical protein